MTYWMLSEIPQEKTPEYARVIRSNLYLQRELIMNSNLEKLYGQIFEAEG